MTAHALTVHIGGGGQPLSAPRRVIETSPIYNNSNKGV